MMREGMVMIMAAAVPPGPGPDLYRLLGVARGASREEIAMAWLTAGYLARGRRW
jgi:hypothetical protein